MEDNKALLFAYKYLARRARTRHEVASYLEKKGFNNKIIEGIIAKLKKAGFIDDREYTRDYIEREKSKNAGSLKMKTELEYKGVGNKIIEKTLKDFNITDKSQCSTAEKLAKSKFRQYGNEITEKLIRKMAYYLARQGFEDNIIEEVLEKYKQDLI